MNYRIARAILSEAIERIDEGAYVPKEREARWQRKGSRKLLRKALARGDKSGAAEWMDNIKDAEQYIPKKKRK